MYTGNESSEIIGPPEPLYVYTEGMTLPVERTSAGDRAYAALLDDIQSGALAAGFVLGEVEQAERLGVSRTPMREALRRLAADGLVVQQSPRVTVVADLDADDIRSLFEIRRALEESSARLAATRGDASCSPRSPTSSPTSTSTPSPAVTPTMR